VTTTTPTSRDVESRAVDRLRTPRWQFLVERSGIYALLLLGMIATGAPYVYMITGSFKLNAQIFSYPLTFIPDPPTMLNYTRLLSGAEIPFVRQFGNSLFVATCQTLLTLLVAAMVGWGFAMYEFRGKQLLFLVLLATLTIPFQIALVPLFLLMLQIGWIDTYWAIIIPGAVSAFGAFFLRQNMLSIPRELLDAARIDGSSEWGIFWRIGLPLVQGALAVLAVLIFLGSWNDYLWPLIVLRTAAKYTYPVGLATLVGLYRIEYGMILAGSFLATLPIILIFIAGRKSLLANMTVGAVKG
jgi:arabinosaccharide transport system permease protein